MSREHIDAVRGVYEGFARGDFSASLGLYDPDVVFIHHLESAEKTVWGSDLAGTYHGLSGLGEYMRNLLEVWSEVTIDAEELVEVGDTVVATIGMQAVGRTAGLSGKIRFFHVWTFRGAKVIRLDVMPEREQALAAVGRL